MATSSTARMLLRLDLRSPDALPVLQAALRKGDPVAAYFIVSAGRFIYLANSPLTSLIEAKQLSV